MSDEQRSYDCLIIGGGPGGLTAAEYLGRFLRKTLVVDSGDSRARWIPTTHNYPGFTDGISGLEFLDRLRRQAALYGVDIQTDEIISLNRAGDGNFVAAGRGRFLTAKTVILATGMVDEKPALPSIGEFIYNGIVRFCPICDGYEAMGKRVAIIGTCRKLYQKACFLRTYTDKLELFPLDDDFGCDAENRQRLQSLGITPPDKKIADIKLDGQGGTGMFEDGSTKDFDFIYPAMGARVRTDFATPLGIKMNDTGCIYADSHQQTNVKGVYAIGDITLDLSQIAVATGQAAIAATAIHNSLPIKIA